MRLLVLVSILLDVVMAEGTPNTAYSATALQESNGNHPCPTRLTAYCCYALDYSGFQVECIGKWLRFLLRTRSLAKVASPGPGKVEYLEECFDYDPRPMCCCGIEPPPNLPVRAQRHL